jgi:hypothetical protein
MRIVKSYRTLALIWRSINVSGREYVFVVPVGHGTVTSLGSGIDRGHSQYPRSLPPDTPSDDEDALGMSSDFAHIGNDRSRKVRESLACAPVMMRPTIFIVI